MLVQYVTFPTKRAYGVELELSSVGITKSKIAKAIKKVDKRRDVAITSWSYSDDNDYWHVKDDSSCGWEIASYVSRGVKDLVNIAKVTDSVYTAGGTVTTSCGFHLHVDVGDFTKEQVGKLVAIWMKIENVVINAVPAHRVGNKYCRLMNDFHMKYRNKDLRTSEGLPGDPEKFWAAVKPNLSGSYDRYRRVALNIWNFASNDRPTVEFRFPEGTLDSKDVKNWIRLLVRLVDHSLTLPFPEGTHEVSLSQALQLMGLAGTEDFFLLSHGLRDTKEWFLYRLIRYSRNKQVCRDAVEEFNNMWSPAKAFELSPDYETVSELT
jgi:hypothetical protein